MNQHIESAKNADVFIAVQNQVILSIYYLDPLTKLDLRLYDAVLPKLREAYLLVGIGLISPCYSFSPPEHKEPVRLNAPQSGIE